MPSSTYPYLFINLHVASLEASTKFYSAIGFVQNKTFSNDKASMMALNPNEKGLGTINVTLLTHEFFNFFLKSDRKISDPTKSTEVLLCLSEDSREDVDATIAKAESAGGKTGVVNTMEMPGMHGGSFEDLDGHIWEVMWMSAETAENPPME